MSAYLALCRFPAVFTALADVLLGLALAGALAGPRPGAVLAALAASAGLYLGGMVLNDLLDREKDAAERPSRPIPSGRVSVAAAWRFYAALTLGGLACAAFGGTASMTVGASLVGMIWLYDGPLKRTPPGPAAMGACRSLNVLLAAAAGGGWAAARDPATLAAAGVLGIYVAGLTAFARTEAVESSKARLRLSSLVVNAALVGIVAWGAVYGRGYRSPVPLVAFGAVALLINRRLAAAVRDRRPPAVGAAVRQMILSIPVLDATLMVFSRAEMPAAWAAACALLVVPAATAGRVLKIT